MASKDCSSSSSSAADSEDVSPSEFEKIYKALINIDLSGEDKKAGVLCFEDKVASVPWIADKNPGVNSDDESSSSSNSTAEVDPASLIEAKRDSEDLINNNVCDQDKLIDKDADIRSVFDRLPPENLRMGKEALKQGIVDKKPTIFIYRPESDSSSDWTSSEDKMLLRVIHDVQGIPLNLILLKPGHLPNWDLASEAVSTVGSRFKSANDCYNRFLKIMKMCQEGEMSYGYNPEEPKKTKGMNKPVKRSTLYEDDNKDYTNLFSKRAKLVMELAEKRKIKDNARRKKTEITSYISEGLSYLNELGINYDKPLTPMEIAKNRKERIHKRWKTAFKLALSSASSHTEGSVSATPTNIMELEEMFDSDSEECSWPILASGTTVSSVPGATDRSVPDSTTVQKIGTEATNIPTDQKMDCFKIPFIPCETCFYVASELSPVLDDLSIFCEEPSTHFSCASEDESGATLDVYNPPVESVEPMNLEEFVRFIGRPDTAPQPSFCVCNYSENEKN